MEKLENSSYFTMHNVVSFGLAYASKMALTLYFYNKNWLADHTSNLA
jgi:hypothetical protein